MNSSVQKYQINQKDEEFSKELLKNGQIVTSYEVLKKTNAYFEHHTPGLPCYKPHNFEDNETSDPEHFNYMFKNLREDLETSFNVFNIQRVENLINKEKYDLEILKINKEIDNLVLYTEILDKYSKKKVSYIPNVITFHDLKYVNMKNKTENNISKTTAEIDFETSTIRNKIHTMPNDKINMQNADVLIESNNIATVETSDAKNILSESLSNITNVKLETMSNIIPKLYITVVLNNPVEISRVQLKASGIINSDVKLLLSSDGKNFLEREVLKGKGELNFRFNKETVAAFKIEILKTSYDYLYKNTFSYLYSIINLSLYNDKYEDVGVYVSKAIDFKPWVSDIIIEPMQNTPPQTDISYFIAYEDKDDNANWLRIDPFVPTDLNVLTKERKFLNYDTTDAFGDSYKDSLFQDTLYKLYNFKENTSVNSIQLRAGLSQWLIESILKDPVDGKVDLRDYNKSLISAIAPLDATISEVKCEKKNNYFVMSKYVVCKKDIIIEDRFIEFDSENEIFDAVVLVNGKQIFPKKDKYSFKLKAGENTIKIMIALTNLEVSNLENIKTIKHNFNILNKVHAVYAGPKMKRIDFNSLSKNVSRMSLKYYTIKEINGINTALVKFDPNFIIKPTDPHIERLPTDDTKTNNAEYLRIMLDYKHLTPKMKEHITNKYNNSNIRIRVMARLSTLDRSTTPTINSIKVIGE